MSKCTHREVRARARAEAADDDLQAIIARRQSRAVLDARPAEEILG